MTTEKNSRIEKAVVKLRRLSADEQARYIFDMHEKARRDEESLLRWARTEGRRESDEKWQIVVADKDAAIANKDAEIAGKDAEITRLREQLEKHP